MTVPSAVLVSLVALFMVLVFGAFLAALTSIGEAFVHRRPRALLGALAVAVGTGAALYGSLLVLAYSSIAI